MAEAVRFELTIRLRMPVFKTGALNRSATLPLKLSIVLFDFLCLSSLRGWFLNKDLSMGPDFSSQPTYKILQAFASVGVYQQVCSLLNYKGRGRWGLTLFQSSLNTSFFFPCLFDILQQKCTSQYISFRMALDYLHWILPMGLELQA